MTRVLSKCSKDRKDRVTVRGAWLPMPLTFLRSRAFAELSLHAKCMLFDLCSMLGANARRNGDLSAPPSIMRTRGWTSNATRTAALKELETAQLIVITRRGSRSRCALYAVTLWPLDCDRSKLEVTQGAYSCADWEVDARRAAAPTSEMPANWATTSQNRSACPATGQSDAVIDPTRAKASQNKAQLEPTRGAKTARSKAKLYPPGDTYLEGHLPPLVDGPSAAH